MSLLGHALMHSNNRYPHSLVVNDRLKNAVHICQSTSNYIFSCEYLFAHTLTCFESRELFSSNFASGFSVELGWSYSTGVNKSLCGGHQ